MAAFGCPVVNRTRFLVNSLSRDFGYSPAEYYNLTVSFFCTQLAEKHRQTDHVAAPKLTLDFPYLLFAKICRYTHRCEPTMRRSRSPSAEAWAATRENRRSFYNSFKIIEATNAGTALTKQDGTPVNDLVRFQRPSNKWLQAKRVSCTH